MIKLRPHHLLCSQTYIGKGYNKVFTENMDMIVNSLRENENQLIEIVFHNDSICKKCPHNIDKEKCESDNIVLAIDNRIKNVLNLSNKSYSYGELISTLNSKLTKSDFVGFCDECSWWEDICKDIFIKKVLNK